MSRPPTVVIDVERTRNLNCGLGQICLHLGRAIVASAGTKVRPVLLARPAQQELFAARSPQMLAASVWRRELVTAILRPLITTFGRPTGDLWHATHQDTAYLPADRTTPLVLTIHDLNFLREKGPLVISRRLGRLQRLVDRATFLTTASRHAAGEIREHLELGGKTMEVVPHGVCVDPDGDEAASGGIRNGLLPQRPFLFAIGDITAKKNFYVLVDLAVELPEYSIVIAGNKATGYGGELERRIHELGVGDRVSLPGVVSDAERACLYRACEAFLFPSLSEGFGMPVLEAMRYARPVFCSDATSLPEVAGPMAFYWTDFDPPEMARVFRAGMAQVAADPGFAAKLRNHADRFTWGEAARRYLAIYQRVLELDEP